MMNKKYTTILLICLFTLSAFSQDKKPLENETVIKNKLVKKAKETSSIISPFTQEKHVSYMKEPQHSKGIFYYQQENKMRWEQTTPFKYVLLMSNGKIRIKEKGKEKKVLTTDKMTKQVNTLMLGMINGSIFHSKKEFYFKYSYYKGHYIVVLTPKSRQLKSRFKSIELIFSSKTIRLKTLTLNEKSGDKSVMKFFNSKFNEKIKESIFNKL